MRFQYSAFLLGTLLSVAEAGPVERKFSLNRRTDGPYPPDEVDKLLDDSLGKFQAWLAKNPSNTSCTLENAARRMEWSDLSEAQRKEYTAAVRCLQTKPPISPRDQVPGALSRYDDFVASHITLAMQLHSNPHLFPAHRLFIHAYEKALREECGYTGYQPYWNWGRYAADPVHSPLFNGNESSMGGNGGPAAYPGIPQPAFAAPFDVIPPAGGGGCVTEGPFKDMVVSLGPKGGVLTDVGANPRADALGSNPRCLRRDVNRFSASVTFANYTYALITGSGDVDVFLRDMLGVPARNDWGVHTGGHYTIGGDPGGDFWASPGDPVFYLHHGMIDRIWWIWQMQDPDARMDQVPGMGSMGPMGAYYNASEDVVDLGWTAPRAVVADLLTNVGGLGGVLCFVWV